MLYEVITLRAGRWNALLGQCNAGALLGADFVAGWYVSKVSRRKAARWQGSNVISSDAGARNPPRHLIARDRHSGFLGKKRLEMTCLSSYHLISKAQEVLSLVKSLNLKKSYNFV